MAVCTGRGDVDGGHCCWIAGELCEFLFTDRGGTPRCSLWDINMRRSSRWRNAPVGQMFAERWPGFDCKDWPQNIPSVMEAGIGLCCWRNSGDLG